MRLNIFSRIRSFIFILRSLVGVAKETSLINLRSRIAHSDFLLGQVAAQNIRSIQKLRELADAEFSVTSQWGEDGIIEWLVHQLDVKESSFVEFGVEDFREANCRFLLENRNWRGLIFDGSSKNIDIVKSAANFWKYDLVAQDQFITAENINNLIKNAGFEGELGVLSVDIDGMDYWVLKAITCVNPQILIVEYNGVFGDLQPVSVPYSSDFTRHSAHYSGLYYGASLKAVQELAESKGYVFVGTPRTGVNAFFVRKDLAPKILDKLERITAYPTRYREARDPSFQLTYARGMERFLTITGEKVVHTKTGEELSLENSEEFYSPEWLKLVK